MYQGPNQQLLPYNVDDDHALEVDGRETQQHFDEFYEDIFHELRNYGKVEELNVCDNIGPHLIGNVYVKFRHEEDADKALKGLTGRFYAGRPILCEFSPVTDFREACCRQFDYDECTRSGECNFMHLKDVSPDIYKTLFGKYPKERFSRGGWKGQDIEDNRKDRDREHGRDRGRDRGRSSSRDRHKRRSRDRSSSRDRHRHRDDDRRSSRRKRSRSRDNHHESRKRRRERSKERSRSRSGERRRRRSHDRRERDEERDSKERGSPERETRVPRDKDDEDDIRQWEEVKPSDFVDDTKLEKGVEQTEPHVVAGNTEEVKNEETSQEQIGNPNTVEQ
eukprot:TRINITY_DN1274_c0_g1_i1.p1 TRINITY_DN1274_c0_g1~~TRINITY_DN1274_c0_g1_i1.p1  ORF type:complete len:335 (+),score=75.46 TRINITY_DN1274_c0_g1_i1:298-1302(+)